MSSEQMNSVKIESRIVEKIQQIVKIALEYEEYFDYERKLGITGEVGEILACYYFDLELMKGSRNKGYDALDSDKYRVEIKTLRKEPKKGVDSNLKAGRISSFSKHQFDYCLLLLLDQKYTVKEVWKADFEKLKVIIEKEAKRNPSIKEFVKRADRVVIPKKLVKKDFSK